jgi:hypothetical protein
MQWSLCGRSKVKQTVCHVCLVCIKSRAISGISPPRLLECCSAATFRSISYTRPRILRIRSNQDKISVELDRKISAMMLSPNPETRSQLQVRTSDNNLPKVTTQFLSGLLLHLVGMLVKLIQCFPVSFQDHPHAHVKKAPVRCFDPESLKICLGSPGNR